MFWRAGLGGVSTPKLHTADDAVANLGKFEDAMLQIIPPLRCLHVLWEQVALSFGLSQDLAAMGRSVSPGARPLTFDNFLRSTTNGLASNTVGC